MSSRYPGTVDLCVFCVSEPVTKRMHLHPRVSGLLPFIHVVVTVAVASAFTPHSKRTSVPWMTFMLFGFVTIKVGSERKKCRRSCKQHGSFSNSTTQLCDNATPTFDLHSYLALFSSCHIADHTQVSSLVLCLNPFDLQSPISVGLVAVPLKVPLAVPRPVWTNPETKQCTLWRTHARTHTHT